MGNGSHSNRITATPDWAILVFLSKQVQHRIAPAKGSKTTLLFALRPPGITSPRWQPPCVNISHELFILLYHHARLAFRVPRFPFISSLVASARAAATVSSRSARPTLCRNASSPSICAHVLHPRCGMYWAPGCGPHIAHGQCPCKSAHAQGTPRATSTVFHWTINP
jgi:hypothetical protein